MAQPESEKSSMNNDQLVRVAIPIMEALAHSDMPCNDNSGDLECLYCNLSQHENFAMKVVPLEHDRECLIRRASEWLMSVEVPL